ncbi:MAG TPA: hypothetical protein VFI02_02800 [Armatimonadota bacterium]|nr:hypothetical protein [Armatimonadota bacterium]
MKANRYKLPPIERRIKYELAHRGWSLDDLRQRMEEVTGEPCSMARISAILTTDNPQTKTLSRIAEALGMDVKRFYEEEL